MELFDVAIIGSGPAGASCAVFCAQAGIRCLVLERETFPREKVCGDCLNPSCTPVLERLGVAERVRALPHGNLSRVDFMAIDGQVVSVPLPQNAEIAIKRSLFDQLLMTRARETGATVHDGVVVTGLTPPQTNKDHWKINTPNEPFTARALVAADGRNSTVARLLGLLPRAERERVGLQTHLSLPADFGDRIVLQFLPEGYSGQAPVGDGQLNLCLVGKPHDMPRLRRWAEMKFNLSPTHIWRTITPLRRAALPPARKALFLIGDAARVVEPFTGEGIFYALRSGELTAEAIKSFIENGDAAAAAHAFTLAHEKLYRGRLWINRIARAAVLSPRITSLLLRGGLIPRPVLHLLTAKVSR